MRFQDYFFKQMLKISAFYLGKQKSFIPKKNMRVAKSELASISKEPALYTVLIFSDGFGPHFVAHKSQWSIIISFGAFLL